MSTQRSSHWMLTINNNGQSDYDDIDRARQKGWQITGQQEVGENGTPHLQLHLATPQVRFSAVKKTFPRAHIEVARNVQATENYVNKKETRTGYLPTSQEKYPSLSKFLHLVYNTIHSRNWIDFSDDSIEHWWKDAHDDLEFPQSHMRREEHRQEFAMLVFNYCVKDLISLGYHIDQFYSPPNMNLWKKFHFAILQRCYLENNAQTASQTDVRLIDENSIPPQEYNHADQDVSSQESVSSQASSRSTSPSPESPHHSSGPIL